VVLLRQRRTGRTGPRPDLSWLASGAADYVGATVLRTFPGSRWALTPGVMMPLDAREPILEVDGAGQDNIHVTMTRMLAGETISRLLREGYERPREPNDLRDYVDRRFDPAQRPKPEPESEPEAPYDVDLAPLSLLDKGSADHTAMVSFSDVVAHRQSGRVGRFVRALAKADGVERAFREDREIVYVDAPRLTAAELTDLIERSWEDAAGART
jgi:hypothetical protein